MSSSASIVMRLRSRNPRVYSASRSRSRHGPGVGELGAHHEQYERIENVVAGAKVAVPSSRVDVADDLDVVL
jgi:hypothetical protein